MNAFELIDVHSTTEAVALLQRHGRRAWALAAGGDLLGLLKDGVRGPALVPPQVVVNLATVPELGRVDRDEGGWSLGAMTTLATLARTPGLPPMLVEAIGRIASPQLRAQTTLGGNLLQRPRCLYFRHPDETCFKKGGTGCPALGGPVEAYPGSLLAGACLAGHPSDVAPVLIALDAAADICGPSGMRRVALAALYRDAASRVASEADMTPDEVLVRIRVPAADIPQAFEKVAPRDANEFATASAAIAGSVLEGRWQALRMALAGVAPGPLVLPTGSLIGQPIDACSGEALAIALLPAPSDDRRQPRLAAARLAIERAFTRICIEVDRGRKSTAAEPWSEQQGPL